MHHSLRTADLLERLAVVTLVDALGAPYFETGHLPGAVNIPPHRVRQRADALLPDKDDPIVVYGSDDHSSNARIVIDQLRSCGYTDLSFYLDGLEGWAAAGLPVERAPLRTSPAVATTDQSDEAAGAGARASRPPGDDAEESLRYRSRVASGMPSDWPATARRKQQHSAGTAPRKQPDGA